MFHKEKEELDTKHLNEVIRLSRHILKIVFILIALLLIYIGTKLIQTWNVIPFIKTILSILSPLFIGLVIAWLFDPFVTKLNKKGINRIIGTIIVFVIFLGGLTLLGFLIYPSLTSQINEIAMAVPNFINEGMKAIDDFFLHLSNQIGFDLTDTKLQILNSLNQFGTNLTTSLPTMSMNLISSLISGSVNLAFGLIIGFYMLFDFHNVRKHLLSLVPKKHHKEVMSLIDQLNNILHSFVRGTLLIAGLLFILQSIGLTLAGMKAPLVFGLFCAITDIIPYIGPWIGGIPVVLVAFSISPTVGVFSLISVIVSQTLENYFLQPIVMGKTMKLHPVTIMMGLLLFGYYFGIIGMIIATPLISTFKLLFQFFNNKYGLIDRFKEENGNIKNKEKEE